MPDGGRILVIEDDRDILRGLAVRLRAGGHEVLTAADARAGLDLAHAAHPSAIVLDLRIPGIDGFEILRRLRAEHVCIPVLVVSANNVEEARDRALEMGAAGFLEKPYQPERLLTALRTAVGRTRSGLSRALVRH